LELDAIFFAKFINDWCPKWTPSKFPINNVDEFCIVIYKEILTQIF